MGFLEDVVSGMYSEAGGVQYQPQRVSNGYDYGTGFYRFGGEDPNTAELLMTLAANELGLDNARRAWNAGQRGDWGEALKEGAFAIASPLSWIYGGGAVTGALKGGRALSALGRSGRALRAAGTATRAAGLRHPFRAARAGIGGVVKPALRVARRNPRLAIPAALAAGIYANVAGNDPAPASSGQPSALLTGGATAPTNAAAARYAGMADRIKEQGASPAGKSYRSLAEMQAGEGGRKNPNARAAAEALVASGGGNQPSAQAGASMGALNAQYNKALANLRSQYQLAETDEERARLKFMLEDIEAQRAAGVEAISSIYAEKESKIRDRARMSREGTAAEVDRLGESLGGVASDLKTRLAEQQTGMAQDMRGLGLGAAATPSGNEWLNFAQAMIPVEQQYTQRIGDIGAEGVDWLGDVTSAQGAAQQGDLQRAAAFARSGGIANYQRDVANRINQERSEMRNAELNLLMQQLSASQSASELNARLAAERADQFGPAATQQFISDVAGSGTLGLDDFVYLFAQQFGRLPTPEEESVYSNVYGPAASDLALQRRVDQMQADALAAESVPLPAAANTVE
jgi:hypothetical protein